MVVRDYMRIERATNLSRGEVARLGSAVLFNVGAMVLAGARFGDVEQSYLLIAAAVIGANDVAMSPHFK